MQTKSKEVKIESKLHFKNFIDENSRLFSVAGVFGALSAFFSSRAFTDFYDGILAALSFAIFLLLCLELIHSFYEQLNKTPKISYTMLGFLGLFVGLVVYLVIYFLQTFQKPSVMIAYVLLIFVYEIVFLMLAKKLKFTAILKKYCKTTKRKRFVEELVFDITILIAVILANLSVVLIKSFLGI